MTFLYKEEFSTDEVITIDFIAQGGGGAMDEKKDFSVILQGSGGHTGAADVNMSIAVWADIAPQEHVQNGAVIDTTSWINVTPSLYRIDQNAQVDSAAVIFSGTAEDSAWLDMDDLNADRLKFVISFDAAPSGTPAELLIKTRRDDI